MSYKLYTDRNENFICEVQVKNASLRDSKARLILESDDGNINLIFHGQIQDGKCIIPIRKLKGLLEENSRGKIHLEMIIEDTYFEPYHSDFLVEQHTSVKVENINNIINDNTVVKKPVVEVKVIPNNPKKKTLNNDLHISKREIAMICEHFGIRKNNLKKNKKDFLKIIKEYFRYNPEYKNHKLTILTGIDKLLR